jgi:hypothetical protein
MAEQRTSFVKEGVDRLQDARERIDDEIQRVQKQMKTRRRKLEREFDRRRKRFEKQTRKQVKQLEKEFRSNALVKRAEELRGEASRQIEDAFENLLGALQLASKQDLQRIDRKLSRLNRKLRELEQERKPNGQQPSASA